MKRFAFVAAAVVLAACSSKEQTPATDTAAPAMTPAPAAGAAGGAMAGGATDSTAMKAANKMDTAAKKMDSAASKMNDSSAMKGGMKKP